MKFSFLKKSYKLVSLVLIIAICLSLCSCSPKTAENTKEKKNTESDDNRTNYSAVKDYFTEAEALVNQLPDLDFEGEELRIAAPDYSTILPDVVKDAYSLAISYRNRLVEKKLNCKIVKVDTAESGSFVDTINEQNSSDNCCEIAYVPSSLLPTLITQNVVSDVDMLPFIDRTKPYYDIDSENALSLGSHMYALSGSATYSPENEFCVYYNDRVIESLGLENPVELYKSNNWTWDKLGDMASASYKDIDGNGYFDENDRYGLTTTVSDSEFIDLICASSNEHFVNSTPSSLNLTYNTDKTIRIIGTSQYILSQKMFFGDKSKQSSQANGLFINGGSLFMIAPLSEAVNISAMKNDFGIVPLPKLYSSDDSFYTPISDSAPVMCVLSSAKNTDLAGAAIEALSAASYHSLEKAFADLYMQYYLRDETSVRMLSEVNKKLYYDVIYSLGDTHAELMQFTVDIIKNAVIKGGDFKSGYRVAEIAFNKFVANGSIDFK